MSEKMAIEHTSGLRFGLSIPLILLKELKGGRDFSRNITSQFKFWGSSHVVGSEDWNNSLKRERKEQ
jgi:hypothetical protein